MAIQQITTIDAHSGGQPVRLVTTGFPRPVGRTLIQQQEWLRRNADHLRRAVVLPPRGQPDLTAALLVDPPTPAGGPGLVVMDAAGYRNLSGHALIAVTTIALERGLVTAPEASSVRVVFETPAGPIPVRARLERRGATDRVDGVAFTTLPSCVVAPACVAPLDTRTLRVDIAYGGECYAIVDTEATGVPLEEQRLADLRRLGAAIGRAFRSRRLEHPACSARHGIAGVVLTGPPHDPEAHLRSVVVTGDGIVNRSPGGTGTAAVMAVLDAIGLLPEDQVFVNEGLSGERYRGRVLRRTLTGDTPAIVAEIEGTAWITGEHTFFLDDDDPFREGWGMGGG